jgi:hypothetical protein
MNDSELLIAVVIISGLTLLGLLVLAIFVYRIYREHDRKPESRLSQLSQSQQRLAKTIRPLVSTSQPLESVITKLNFTESFDPERFAIVGQECALSHIKNMLASQASDGVTLAVNSLRLSQSGAELIVSASKDGKVLLNEGTAVIARHRSSGQFLPKLKDVRTGKWIEDMKGVPTAKVMSRVGAMSAAIVGAAHIISGADIAKRLKQIDSKMNLLLAYRKIDQMATLERIYTSAKELGCGPMCRDKSWELWRLRGEVRELRYRWRRELHHHLSLIDDPETASWFKRMFTRKKTSDSKIHGQITEGQLQLGMIAYAMRLDHVLAVGSGTINEFETTLNGELIELQSVADLLRSKAELISGKYPDLSIEPTVNGMVNLVEQYKQLLPDAPAPEDSEKLPNVEITTLIDTSPQSQEVLDAND